MTQKYILSTSPGFQRNEGLGDYFERADGSWAILATDMNNPLHSDLILVHELIEVLLIRKAGIPEPVIDAFDAYFEIKRKYGLVGEDDEPGDDPTSPYYHEHQVATEIEKIMCCKGMNIDWDDYDKACIDYKPMGV